MIYQVMWKFEIHPSTLTEMPLSARIVHAGAQWGDHIVVWAICDPEAPKVQRKIAVIPTGSTIPPDLEYFDTVQMDNGLVFHIFLGPEIPDGS